MNEGPEYTCAICIKQEWKSNVLKLNKVKYEEHSKMFDECYQLKHFWLKEIIDPKIFANRFEDKEEYICKGCDKHLMKGKMPPQAQANNLKLDRIEDDLRDLCPLELMLISRIIPFMFIVPKHKGAQFGLKGQCILVPSDLKKTVSSLPRACDDNCVISLALKRRLSDRSYHSKQNIRPAEVNKALRKLKEINPFYSFVSIDENSWVNVSQESDPELWDMLTNDEAKPDNVDLTDSDEEIEGNDVTFEKQKQDSTVPHPTVLHNINGTNVEPGEVLNLAPAEGQIPVSFTSEPDWEALAFVKEFPLGKGHFNENRNVAITPSQYVHTRLKCADDRFANNAQYIFAQLDLIERAAIWSSITFAENKRFQDNITVGEVKNNIHRMLSDQQIYYTFKNIRGTPQYNRNQLLDILGKVRQFGCYTFFLTITAGIPHFWFEIFQILGHQYGKDFTKEDVMNMSNKERIDWLKRNPVTVARQVDYLFTKFLGPAVIMSGMHPIGQILNYDEKREFQMRGVEHPHCAIHVKDAPKLDENSDDEVVEFIDKFITCSLPDEDTEPELHELVTSRLSHKHTFTCRKKKGVRCRFNAPWPPSKTTRIIRGENLSSDEVKKSKRLVDKVLHEITSMQYGLNDVILEDILYSCGISEEEYENAMDTMQKNTTILYKRQANEINVVPYNTVLLTLLRSNMNIQFVTGSYGLLTYLTAYMCKDDKNMSELMKKASKEASSGDIRGKLKKVGNVFVKNREVGIHEATKRVLSGPFRRSNLQTIYIPTGPQNERIRMLKPKHILDLMSSDDINVFATNMIEKYANRPDILENICYADFATSYKSKNVDDTPDEDHITNYTNPVDIDVEELQVDMQIITLKNGLGKMRKRKKCVMRYHKPSKFSSPEGYYMVLLQLYMPWRNENDIIGSSDSYKEKFDGVFENIKANILEHEPYFGQFDIDENVLDNNLDTMENFDSSEGESDNNSENEYTAFDPSLLDTDSGFEDIDIVSAESASCSIKQHAIPNDTYYAMCSQLNDAQRDLFNYIMKWAMRYQLGKDNDEVEPDPFYIFLSGGAGVGKTYLVNVVIEYLRRILLVPGQNCDESPSIAITASTGKAACNINGTTLHSAFHLPLHGENMNCKTELRGKELQNLQMKYKYLRVLIVDEISMVGRQTFEDLNAFLQQIKNNQLPFGGIAILVIGDFFQLPPVKQASIFERLVLNDPWFDFQLHELTEIVRQNGDPEFAELLNRMREGNETQEDIHVIKLLSETDTSDWPVDHCKLYITNRLKDIENDKYLKDFREGGHPVHTIIAKDLKMDITTNLHKVNHYIVRKDAAISETGNLPSCIEICEGSRVMLTVNLDVSDHLINGAIGTVIKIHRRQDSTKPSGIIFVKFDDPNAGNNSKSNRYRGDLKDCVPIEKITKQYNVSKHKKGNLKGEREQFPLTAAHAMTIHKSQGSTIEYFTGDMDRSCKTANYKTRVNPGMFYTLLSRATARNKVKILNFEEDVIKCNEKAKREMHRLRSESHLDCKHPLTEMSADSICLLNIVSWSKHIDHFLSDRNYTQHSSLFCFTETYTVNELDQIEHHHENWRSIHKHSPHGLAICYNINKVEIIERNFEILYEIHELEVLPIGIRLGNDTMLLVLVYFPTGQLVNERRLLLYRLQTQVERLPRDNYDRIILLGDFNMDQKSPEHQGCFTDLCIAFNLIQRSNWSTHKYGGILDLVFDSNRAKNFVNWMPSPYSDHFVLIIDL